MPLKHMTDRNLYPIIFIGSGMSKRYLKNYPSWIELLEEFWNRSNNNTNFYGKLNTLKSSYRDENVLGSSTHSDKKASFYSNIQIASLIESKFNEEFYKESFQIEGLSLKKAYDTSISPFKISLANKFKTYEIIEGLDKELISFYNFLHKGQIIITTNYDTFIEDTYSAKENFNLDMFVGQEGFFDETIGKAELYKIHGCSTNPSSLIINERDYDLFEKNSVLLASKILVAMINSPIIFLGYSLTDINVRNIIKSFTSQLPKEDPRISANRIIFVQRKENEENLISYVENDSELGHYTVIETDNYKLIYDIISKINQGLSPLFIRRYEQIIKQIIVSKGEKGVLDTFLVSPEDISLLEEKLKKDLPLAVVLGDKKYLYVMPDFLSYMEDYIFEKDEIPLAVALEYVAQSQSTARFPFKRLLDRVSNIKDFSFSDNTKHKLNNKIASSDSIESLLGTISSYNEIEKDSINEIWDDNFSLCKKIQILIFNLKKFYEDDERELEDFLKTEVFKCLKKAFKSNPKSEYKGARSNIRKLYYYYDILKYGEIEDIRLQNKRTQSNPWKWIEWVLHFVKVLFKKLNALHY